jgi:hypothetical protein
VVALAAGAKCSAKSIAVLVMSAAVRNEPSGVTSRRSPLAVVSTFPPSLMRCWMNSARVL